MNWEVVELYSVGKIMFGFLNISENGRLPLHVIITVEMVMVVLLIHWLTQL
jgi:hypothetical protein